MRLFILLLLSLTALLDQQRSAAELSKAGWDALNSGRIREAAAAFDEALTAAPQQAPVPLPTCRGARKTLGDFSSMRSGWIHR